MGSFRYHLELTTYSTGYITKTCFGGKYFIAYSMVRILNWEKKIRFPKDLWNSIHTVVMVFESLYDSTILDLWDINWRLSSSMLLSVGYYNIWVAPWTHKHSFLVNACGNIQVYSYILLAFTNPVFTRIYLLTKKNKDNFSCKIKLTINTNTYYTENML